jgi:tight adherence protein C
MTSTSTLVLAAAGCLALALPLLVWAFTGNPGAERQRVLANLNQGLAGQQTSPQSEIDGGPLVALAHRVTPRFELGLIDRLHARAGRPSAWPIERVMVSKLVLAAVGIAFAALVFSAEPSARTAVFSVFVVLLAWFVPDLLLWNTAIKRRQAIELALPDSLDQLTIAVEAGLGLESAIAHVAGNTRGPLAEEFVRTLQDIQVGQPRHVAYRAMADRVDVKDLRRFINAIAQADKHGVSISRVLSTQAAEMRTKRRLTAEEKAMKIPVKVVFPLVLFILPVLFIVIVGPGVIGIIETFSAL